MALRFVNKRIDRRKQEVRSSTSIISDGNRRDFEADILKKLTDIFENIPSAEPKKEEISEPVIKEEKPKNKKEKKEPIMTDMEQIMAAEAVMTNLEPEVKVVKKDRGLIERTESSKIILTEDNRQVLND